MQTKIRLLLIFLIPLLAFTGDRHTAPTFTSTPTTTIKETEFYEYDIDAEDADGDGFGFRALKLPDWLSFGMDNKARVTTVKTISNPGSTSRFPKLIAGDDFGNLYMADAGNYVVRKITPSGDVSTLAGSGENKYANGTGTGASFVELQGIAVGPDGNIYVSEAGKGTDGKFSHRIRKITPDGVVTDFAGRERIGNMDFHIGTSAEFDLPRGLVFDSKGNLYVADVNNFNLRKVTPEGEVTTFAGLGERPSGSRSSGPVDGYSGIHYLAVDSKDNIYSTGISTNQVLITDTEGNISVFQGAGGIGDTEDTEGGVEKFIKFWEPVGIAIDRDDFVYITDANLKVKRISPDGQRVWHLAGVKDKWERIDGLGDEAAFQTPYALAFDKFQNLYVTETGSQSLRRLSGSKMSGSPLGHAGIHDVSIEVTDVTGASSTQDFQIIVTDGTPPSVVSILRQNPTDEQLSTAQATFRVTFSESVVNVDVSDFVIKDTGITGNVSSVVEVDTKTYDVNLANVGLKKVLNLDLAVGNDIEDAGGVALDDTEVTDTEETYIGPNTPPAFTSSPITTAIVEEEYSYSAVISDIDQEAIDITAPVLPEWLNLQVTTTATELGTIARPYGVAVADDGTIYVASDGDDVNGIYKIPVGGDPEVFAASDKGLQDGTGTDAKFQGAFQLEIGPDGNIYAADAGNSAIRMITPAGVVTTIAGGIQSGDLSELKEGPIASTSLWHPSDMVLDEDGNIFIADEFQRVIRKVNATRTFTTTFAGDGTSGLVDAKGKKARFDSPTGITIDKDGNFYVSDAGNYTIRKITPDGTVTTFAGADESGSKDGTGTEARFVGPRAIDIDAHGNLYVIDGGKIRKITPDGVVSTIEADKSLGFSIGLDVTSDGSIYATSLTKRKVFTSRVTGAKLSGTPVGIAGDFPVTLKAEDGSGGSNTQEFVITIADGTPPTFTSGQTESFEENGTGVVHTVSATDLGAVTYSLGSAKDEALFQINTNSGEVTFISSPDFETPSDGNTDNVYDIEVKASDGTNEASQTVSITVTNANDPPVFTSTPVTEIGDNEVYSYMLTASDVEGDELTFSGVTLPDWLKLEEKFDSNVETFAGTGSKGKRDGGGDVATFENPYDVEVDGAGNVYVVDKENHLIRKISTNGTVSTLSGDGVKGFKEGSGSSARFNNPTGITIESGLLYIADSENHMIRRVGAETGGVNKVSGLGLPGFIDGDPDKARFNEPAGLAIDTDGNIFVADRLNHAIRKIDRSGKVTTYAGSGSAGYQDGDLESALFNLPSDLEFDKDGNLYVIDGGNNRIRKISTEGMVSTLAGGDLKGLDDGQGTDAMLNDPYGITVDDAGNVYFAEFSNHAIRRIDQNGLVTTVAGTGTSGMQDGAAATATFNSPRGLALDASGQLYIADEGNHKIRKIETTHAGFQLTGDPGSDLGSHNVSIKVTDEHGLSSSQDFVINIADATPPKLVSILRNDPAEEKLTGRTATFRVTFDEEIVTVETDDFIIEGGDSNGKITGITKVSGLVYDVKVEEIPDDATVDLSLSSGHELEDANGNKVDADVAPHSGEEQYLGPDELHIVKIVRQSPTKQRLVGVEGTFRVTFSKELGSIDLSDFKIRNGVAELVSLTHVSDNKVYDVVVDKVVNEVDVFLDNTQDHNITDTEGNRMVIGGKPHEVKEVYKGPLGLALNSITRSDPVEEEMSKTKAVFLVDFNKQAVNIDITDFVYKSEDVTGTIESVEEVNQASGNYEVTIKSLFGLGVFSIELNENNDLLDVNDRALNSLNPIGENQSYTKVASKDPVFASLPPVTIYEGDEYDHKLDVFDPEDDNLIVTGDLPSWLNISGAAGYTAQEYHGNNNALETEHSLTQLKGYNSVISDENGNVFVSERAGYRIRKIDSEGNVSTFIGSGEAGDLNGIGTEAIISSARGMAYDKNGNLYFTSGTRIKIATPNGEVNSFVGNAGTADQDGTGTGAVIGTVHNIVIDDSGNLYVSNSVNQKIRKITPEAVVTTFVGLGRDHAGDKDGDANVATFSDPRGLAIKDGHLFVADMSNHKIRKVDLATREVSTYAGTGESSQEDGFRTEATFDRPQALHFDNEGNLWVGSGSDLRIIDKEGNVHTPSVFIVKEDGQLAENAINFGEITDVEVDSKGNIYVTESIGSLWKLTKGNGFYLSGATTGQVGTHDVTLVAKDDNGGETELEFAIEVLSKTPELLKIERYIPEGEFVENPESLSFKLTFDRGMTIGTTDFELKSSTADGKIASVVSIVDTDQSEYFVYVTSLNGFGTLELGIKESHKATSKLHNALLQVTAPSMTNETYLLALSSPAITSISGGGNEFAVEDNQVALNENQLTYQGTTEPGTAVEVFLDDVSLGLANVEEDGTWTLIDNQVRADGEFEINAKATFAASGLESETSQTTTFTVDTIIPEAPVIEQVIEDTGASNSDFITSNDRPIYAGSAEALATVHLYDGSIYLGSSMADENGNWKFQDTEPLDDRIHQISAKAEDAAGNESELSDPISLDIDLAVPDPPHSFEIRVDTGEEDGITSGPFSRIVAFAEPYGLVELFLDDEPIGEVQLEEFSIFSFDYVGDPLGDGTYKITAQVTDLAGNTSELSDPFVLVIDTTSPVAPQITGISEDTGSSDTDGITSDQEITILGTAESSSTVNLYIDDVLIGEVSADADGNFEFEYTTTLNDGTYSITAESIDLAANVSDKSDAFVAIIDTIAPDQPVVTGISDDAGISPTDKKTNDNTLIFHGRAEAGSTVEVFLKNQFLGTTTTDENGEFSYDHTATVLSDGNHKPEVRAIDKAGNISVDSPFFNVSIETDAPVPGSTKFGGQYTNQSFKVLVNFHRAVTGFDQSNLIITNGTISDFVETTYHQIWEMTITPTAEGTFGISIPADVAVDDWGNYNLASSVNSGVYDITPPKIFDLVRISPESGAINTNSITYSISFDEEVLAVDATDFEIIPDLGITGTIEELTRDDITEFFDYTLTVSNISGNGVLRVRSKAGNDMVDRAGNPLSNQVISEEPYSFDVVRPNVTITTPENPTAAVPSPVEICFDKEVTGFSLDDITVGAGTASSLSQKVNPSFSYKLSTNGSGDGEFNDPRGVATDAAGNVFVLDRGNSRIQKFSSTGAFLAKAGSAGTGDGEFDNPIAVAVGPLSNIYVLDRNNSRVQVFDNALNYLFQFGSNGSADGQFLRMRDLSIDADNKIYITDVDRADVQVFDANGNHLLTIGSSGTGDGQFTRPISAGTDGDGNIYVIDRDRDDIQVFDAAGVFQTKFGTSGVGEGQFDNTTSMVVTKSGLIFTTDDSFDRIQYFDSSGTFLGSIGVTGAGDGEFSSLAALNVSDSFELYTVEDSGGNNRIQKFNLSHCFTVDITPDTGGSVTVDVAEDVASDEFGNGNTVATQLSILFNSLPSDVDLSSQSILENGTVGDAVGTFSTTDADASDTHTYTLVAGTGDDDNASFTVSNDQLLAAEVFDLETKASYSIRVMTTDNHGSSFEKAFTITIDNVPEPDMRITGDLQIPATALGLTSNFSVTIHNDGDADLTVSSITYPDGYNGPVTGITVAAFGNEVVTFGFTPIVAQTYAGDITITSDGGTGVLAVSADGSIVTGVDDGLLSPEAIITYPNPAKDLLTIDLTELQGKLVDIQIHDMNGVRKLSKSNYSESTLQLDVSMYSSGLYLILINDKTKMVQKKVMIRR